MSGRLFNDFNSGSVWAKCFEDVINRIILLCVKTREVGDNGGITPHFNAVNEILKYIGMVQVWQTFV